ncbi:MAG: S46 family peptidase [Salinivirgaceae bacterium]|nr:S46 family peptidase [Salinivirgaceae bacterium]
MKKILLFAVTAILLSTSKVRADEGMWLPLLIERNMATMTELGLKLTADDIYNINQACLANAIVALDEGSCTASLVSPEGLLITNHHCGYGEIQNHSTVDNDLLTNGFWAHSYAEELPNPGKSVQFLLKAEDVTERVLSAVPSNASYDERRKIVDSVCAVLFNENTIEEKQIFGLVESVFESNKYYLFVYQHYNDVRLVAAPPESLGKYGGDTDNWMWPRHTCDFSMFRVYCAPDGSPAKYSENNVPLKSKQFLPISLKGYNKGDFSMVMGYPGSTERYITSWETQSLMTTNADRAAIRGVKQDIWKKHMDANEKTRIQYASKYARSSNYWKNAIGQNRGLKRLHVVESKRQLESQFANWVAQSPERQTKYGKALSLIENNIVPCAKASQIDNYLYETQWGGSEIIRFASRCYRLEKKLKSGSTDIEKDVATLRNQATDFFKDYNANLDREATTALVKMYMDNIDSQYWPHYMFTIKNKYKGDVNKFVNQMFAKSIFCNEQKFNAFLAKPSAKQLQSDLAFVAATSIIQISQNSQTENNEKLLNEGKRLFLAGLMEMFPDKNFYPDANSTMRLTYGTVGDYKPADAVRYDYFTTMDGVMEKEDSTNREFIVPAKLKEIYQAKDYGQYGNADGTMNVCFTTNNDITGGNSGSPVINANGELIGLAFDGNWEAMSGDIAFEPELQKCIVVDIRYVMLIIDKFAGAQNLVDEMLLRQ